MTIREIPRSFLYVCDACGHEHRQENAQGHYTESVPPHWSRLRIRESASDNEYLLCESCGIRTILAINRVMDNIKAELLVKGEPKNDTD